MPRSPCSTLNEEISVLCTKGSEFTLKRKTVVVCGSVQSDRDDFLTEISMNRQSLNFDFLQERPCIIGGLDLTYHPVFIIICCESR